MAIITYEFDYEAGAVTASCDLAEIPQFRAYWKTCALGASLLFYDTTAPEEEYVWDIWKRLATDLFPRRIQVKIYFYAENKEGEEEVKKDAEETLLEKIEGYRKEIHEILVFLNEKVEAANMSQKWDLS
jgi:hypothetical protein